MKQKYAQTLMGGDTSLFNTMFTLSAVLIWMVWIHISVNGVVLGSNTFVSIATHLEIYGLHLEMFGPHLEIFGPQLGIFGSHLFSYPDVIGPQIRTPF